MTGRTEQRWRQRQTYNCGVKYCHWMISGFTILSPSNAQEGMHSTLLHVECHGGGRLQEGCVLLRNGHDYGSSVPVRSDITWPNVWPKVPWMKSSFLPSSPWQPSYQIKKNASLSSLLLTAQAFVWAVASLFPVSWSTSVLSAAAEPALTSRQLSYFVNLVTHFSHCVAQFSRARVS